jgi:hypothetical protein
MTTATEPFNVGDRVETFDRGLWMNRPLRGVITGFGAPFKDRGRRVLVRFEKNAHSTTLIEDEIKHLGM